MTKIEKQTAIAYVDTLWQDVMDFKELVSLHGDEFQPDFDKALARYSAVKRLLDQLGIQ